MLTWPKSFSPLRTGLNQLTIINFSRKTVPRPLNYYQTEKNHCSFVLRKNRPSKLLIQITSTLGVSHSHICQTWDWQRHPGPARERIPPLNIIYAKRSQWNQIWLTNWCIDCKDILCMHALQWEALTRKQTWPTNWLLRLKKRWKECTMYACITIRHYKTRCPTSWNTLYFN